MSAEPKKPEFKVRETATGKFVYDVVREDGLIETTSREFDSKKEAQASAKEAESAQ